jgi:hypothetical protein
MTFNKPLAKNLRSQLESTVKTARDVAEKAAHAALTHLGVCESEAPSHLTEDQKALRRRLRAHGRQLGDIQHANKTQSIRHLVWEVAYEHWHRMLFARFLAENHLLMWEPGAAVTLAECEELAQDPSTNLGAKSGWELAAILAARMLPQVFKPHSPVFELRLSPNEQRDLELLLKGLPSETFYASDSLGWVYQFWQAKRKDEVNASEVKIGADELPAVTQLFTEPYMVDFLLHNSLGAWWHTRHPNQTCPVELTYFRKLDDGTPAAGKFEGWPNSLADFTLLDPCCGSGHFLVAAFLLLVPMRIASEGLSAKNAVDAVLADNLHGLEIDPRCVEIAVFALALAAWRYPDESGNALGVRAEMPAPNIACCGLKVAATAEDWEALVPSNITNAALMKQELRLLHNCFAQAPLLGSLLDPSKTLKNDLASFNSDSLTGFLEQALFREQSEKMIAPQKEMNEDAWDLALTAYGLLEAASILNESYHLVVTNVPYLARGKQSDILRDYCERHYADAKNDLANVFLERCLELSKTGGAGVVQIVMPQNWLFLSTYEKQRKSRLLESTWNFIGLLGIKSFQTPMWDFNVQLLTLTRTRPEENWSLCGIDVSNALSVSQKSDALTNEKLVVLSQVNQLSNPGGVVSLHELKSGPQLGDFASINYGSKPGQTDRVVRFFWEVINFGDTWQLAESTPNAGEIFGGKQKIFLSLDAVSKQKINEFGLRSSDVFGRAGVIVSQMASMPTSVYLGQIFDNNTSAVIPKRDKDIPAIYSFIASPNYVLEIRKLTKKLDVAAHMMVKVPFDLAHWTQIAAEKYPNGLPKPYTDDPTQWIFHGHPRAATNPLQVGIARLLGYTWPAESDAKMELSDEARTWIERCKELSNDVDDDGIVCLRAVRGEKPAHERLLTLLINAWETVEPGSWKTSVLDKLLVDADSSGKGLDVWLQDKFFEQHAKLFQHRPFIWHLWDGLKDGFSALINYHKFDTKNLERLIHTYLGDWIRTQEAAVTKGIDGAEFRLAAAQALKKKLEAILEGEAPYDIFVRWKSAGQQSIGWNPDLNDGVRMNIRPFMTAEVLRQNKKPKLNITWDKDRGKDVETAPWFKTFKGERINDHHLTLLEKKSIRDMAIK